MHERHEAYHPDYARMIVKTLVERTLDQLWALSDADLASLIAEHNSRNAGGSHPLRMIVVERVSGKSA